MQLEGNQARSASPSCPDGCELRLDGLQVDQHLLQLKVDALPGVGWSTRQRLEAMGINTIVDLRQTPQDILQRELGGKNGAMIW